MIADGSGAAVLRATITRADGTVEELGVISETEAVTAAQEQALAEMRERED